MQKKSPLPTDTLIVTEGTKTEPTYFGNIKRKYQIPLEIRHSHNSTAPDQIVQYAITLKDTTLKQHKFKHVFVVFDRDDHKSYSQACKLCEEKKFTAITSNPCFELWLLLHFEQVSSPIEKAEEAKQRLQKYIPGYIDKTPNDLFDLTENSLEDACKLSRKLTEEGNHDTNPYTNVHILIEKLKNTEE